jgi:uncharacterized protein (DUF885 family)
VSEVFDIADRFCERLGVLDPCSATYVGIPGHDHEMTDFSPAGTAARIDLVRETLVALDGTEHTNDDDRRAADVMRERFTLELEQYDAGERLRDVRIIGSPIQNARQCFDLMHLDSDAEWAVAAERMRRVPAALESIEASLREGVERGLVAARRQALACAEQAATWGGERDDEPFFRAFAARRPDDSGLADAAEVATAGYAQLAAYLRDEYAPAASPRNAVGRDRYALFARDFNGIELDLDETYAWGWEELHRIEDAMRRVAERILPGASIDEVIQHLDADPARAIEGADEFIRWNQGLIDQTIADLDGTHFDIAAPLQKCEAMIAAPGSAAAMYYTAPTEDFSRPGRTWYPTMGETRFPLWKEVSTCYHEAVPGHHLQVAQVVYLADRLSRYQRLFGFVSGHGEGWALYAERLMGELGYLEDPAFELGMLAAQAMRAVRIVVDIGMHLELPIIDGEPNAGATWTPELALPFVVGRSRFPEVFMRSEVDRYLGWPGQAISYKVGERVWLECRAEAKQRKGAAFDLKEFHTYALDLGSMGLAQLREELARF